MLRAIPFLAVTLLVFSAIGNEQSGTNYVSSDETQEVGGALADEELIPLEEAFSSPNEGPETGPLDSGEPITPRRARAVSEEEFERILKSQPKQPSRQGGVKMVSQEEFDRILKSQPKAQEPPAPTGGVTNGEGGDGFMSVSVATPEEWEQIQKSKREREAALKQTTEVTSDARFNGEVQSSKTPKEFIVELSFLASLVVGSIILFSYVKEKVFGPVRERVTSRWGYATTHPSSRVVAIAILGIVASVICGWAIVTYPIHAGAGIAGILLMFGLWGLYREAKQEKDN